MREIEFRGYSIKNNNHWYYGLLGKIYRKEEYYIEDTDDITIAGVEIDSIGQYTGFKDKNGKKIYEGDKCKRFGKTYIIKYNKGSFIGVCNEDGSYTNYLQYLLNEIEVISNVYEDKLKEN